MNILKQYETINQEIKNYSPNNFVNLIVVTKGRSYEDIQIGRASCRERVLLGV